MIYCSIYDKELYQGAYWPHITHQYSRTWTSYAMNYHKHVSTEIMYLFMGDCSIFVRGGNGAEHEIHMRGGDFIMLDSDVVHRLFVRDGGSCYMLNIEFLFEPTQNTMHTMRNIYDISEYMERMVQIRQGVTLGNDVSGELYRAFSVLLNSYLRISLEPANRCLFDAELTVFFLQLARSLDQSNRRARKSTHVRKAIRYIENNFDQPLNVGMIAEHVGVHPAYLQRIFRESVDSTPMEYLARLRIDKAMVLLENISELSIDEISRLVGFASRQRFADRFKQLEHVTPSEYRKAQTRAERTQFTLDLGLPVFFDPGSKAIMPISVD